MYIGMSASNELWRIILEGFKPYNPDKLTRREAVDSQLNNTALHMIQTSVGTQELPRVRNYTTAKEAWDGLAASCIGSESTRRNKYNALRNQAEGFMRLPDEDHQVMYGRLLIVADAFRLSGATHINDSWIKEKYIECMMPFVPIDVKTLVGRECYSSLSSQDAVHEMQALKVLEQNSHDSRNRAIGMAKGNNLALTVNSVEEVHPQEQYRASWSMSYPEDLECHYHDHMAFHAKSFWVDPSKAKEDNIKRNHKSGFTSFGPKTRSCYNCDDKRHFIAECPYENRELHNGRLIPKDKSKESKGKYSKAPNKKFYNNKTKKGKRPPRVVLVTREEYSSDEVESSSDDEGESSKEVAAIVTTNIPSSSLFESPNENPHIKNAHCFMATSSLDTSIVLSTQEEYSSGDDDVDDEEDATSNGLVALASLSTNSSSPSESPNEIIHVEEESCLMAKSSEVSSPSPSMPNISSDLGVDDASLKVKQEMLEFDEFMFNLQGINKKHVSNLMARLAQQNDMLEKKGQIEREDSLEIHALKNALEESQETIASLEERLENLEEPQDEINKLTKARDHARAKTKLLKKEMAQFGVDHEKLVKDLDELDKAHKALKSEYSLLSKSNEQLQIRLASYDVPSSSTPSCDHANIIEENARLEDELAKASSPQSKLSLDDLLSKQRSNNGKEGLGYVAKAKKANKQKAKPAQEKKKAITNGEAPKGNTINNDDAGNANPNYDYAAGGSKWVLDSGCTSHMTGGKNLVKELRPNINNITVSFGDNSTSELMMHQSKNKKKTLPLMNKIKDKINQEFKINHLIFALHQTLSKIKHMRMSILKKLRKLKLKLMTDRFEMSMMGEMKFFLGFEIKQLREGTFINQAKYLQDMLKRFKMTELKGVATPMVTKCQLALDPNGKEVDQKDAIWVTGRMGLQDLMKIRCDYSPELVKQFFATLAIKKDEDRTMEWMSGSTYCSATLRRFGAILGVPVEEGRRLHGPQRADKNAMFDLYTSAGKVGTTKGLLPIYGQLLRFFRSTIAPSGGNNDAIRGSLVDLMCLSLRCARDENEEHNFSIDIMDYIFHEIHDTMVSRNTIPYAPYIQLLINNIAGGRGEDLSGYPLVTHSIKKAYKLKTVSSAVPPPDSFMRDARSSGFAPARILTSLL
ncbi:hypothetical protein QYE76_064713 [Lolium multiflorum]|uniref:CCHC-type domain-containing protein n=1 Tax=Lolium multiflorum TaxID=4521 RepID=A0AAD8W867_LOLMU|nr:hypothetical protein QYE76_064713 [Lolium multiflorum]